METHYLKLIVTASCVFLISGCGDSQPPTSGQPVPPADAAAEDGAGTAIDDVVPESDPGPVDDTVEAGGTVSGLAALGRPVTGASVEIVAFGALQPGETLGSGPVTESGGFEVPIAPHTGLVLIRVTGGSWSELSGANGEFDPDDELLLIAELDATGSATGVNVHALNTLAVDLAQAYGDAGLTPTAALSQASTRLAEHLLRAGFNSGLSPAADLTIGPAVWPSGPTALGLFHAGLAQMALELGNEAGSPLTTLDVLGGLRRDISDGLFDGVDADGANIQVLGAYTIDVETTRWTLAKYTQRWLETADNASGLGYDELAGDDGFHTYVSTDEGPLYPPGPVKRFDERPPVLTFEPPTPEDDGSYGAQPFTLSVSAVDASVLADLTLVKPTGAAVSELVVSLEKGTLTATIDPKLLPDGDLLVLVTATDASDNTAEAIRTLLIDTTAPVLTVELLGAFSDAATAVNGTASDATSGVASVTVQTNDEVVEAVLGEGSSFLAEPDWPEGSTTVLVTATDAAGNATTHESTATFDPNVPTITVTSPPKGFVGPGPFDMTLEVDSATPVTDVTVQLEDVVTKAEPQGLTTWLAKGIEPPDADGIFTAVADAKNQADSTGTVSVEYTRDGTAPVVLAASLVGGVTVDDVFWTSATTGTLSLTVSDGDGAGVASVCGASPCQGVLQPDGTWHITVDAAPGAVTLTDKVGNGADFNYQIGQDEDGPECAMALVGVVVVGGKALTKKASVTVQVTASDPVGVSSVVIEANGDWSATPDGDGKWTATVDLKEGDNVITATCKDKLDNPSESSSIGVTRDSTDPIITLLTPAKDSYVGKEPFTVTFEVEDDSEITVAEVTAVGSGETVTAQQKNGDWSATVPPPDSEGIFVLQIVVHDAAENVDFLSVPLFVDLTAPTATVSVDDALVLGGKNWLKTQNATLVVTPNDAGAGVKSVCAASSCDEEPENGKYLLAVAVPEEGSNEYTVVFTDNVGNSADATVTVDRDTVGPTCTADTPALANEVAGEWWFGKGEQSPIFTGTVSDDGVGGSQVTVKTINVALPATVEGGTWSISFKLPKSKLALGLDCADALGNTAPAAFGSVHYDPDPPELTLAFAQLDDEATAAFSIDGGSVKFNDDSPTVVAIPASCAMIEDSFFACGSFSKFTSRLVYEAEPDIGAQNLLTFNPQPNDVGSAIDPASLVLEYSFERLPEETLTSWKPVPWIGDSRRIPLALPYVTDQDPTEFSWAPENIPEVIAIRAVDFAGNKTEIRWSFEMKLLAPPLFVEPLPTWQSQGWDLTNFALQGGPGKSLSQLFSSNPPAQVVTKGGARLARYSVFNPHDQPVAFTAFAPAALRFWTEAQRRYLRDVGGYTGCPCGECTCAEYACKYSLNGQSGGACTASPPQEGPSVVVNSKPLSTSLLYYEPEDIDDLTASPIPPVGPEGRLVGPGESVVLDLLVGTTGKCLVGTQVFTHHPKGGAFNTEETLTLEIEGAACGEPGDSYEDQALCADNLLFGCSTLRFSAPRVVLEASFGVGWPDGPQTLDLQLTHHVPGFGTGGPYTVERPITPFYTTEASDKLAKTPFFLKDEL